MSKNVHELRKNFHFLPEEFVGFASEEWLLLTKQWTSRFQTSHQQEHRFGPVTHFLRCYYYYCLRRRRLPARCSIFVSQPPTTNYPARRSQEFHRNNGRYSYTTSTTTITNNTLLMRTKVGIISG